VRKATKWACFPTSSLKWRYCSAGGRCGNALYAPAGHPVFYGDAEDPEFIATLPLARTRWVVSTAHERHVSQGLIHTLRNLGYAGRIAVTAPGTGEVARLEQASADLVLVPLADAAHEVADRFLGQIAPVPPA